MTYNLGWLSNSPNFSTTFAATENPISEGGVWTNGLAVGLDWTNVCTSGGLAIATQVAHTPPPYDDSIACLSGYPANQFCTAVLSAGTITGAREVELLLHWKISAHNATGYEVDIISDGRVDLTRWNGAVSDYTIVVATTTNNVSVANGAVWYAEALNGIITVKCNGATCFTYNYSGDGATFQTGNPGIGFYADTNAGAPSAASTFSWASFSAGSL